MSLPTSGVKWHLESGSGRQAPGETDVMRMFDSLEGVTIGAMFTWNLATTFTCK